MKGLGLCGSTWWLPLRNACMLVMRERGTGLMLSDLLKRVKSCSANYQRARASSQEKNIVTVMEKEQNDNAQLDEPSTNTQKTASAQATWTTGNTKTTKRYTVGTFFQKPLEVTALERMSSRSYSRNTSLDSSTESEGGEFDDDWLMQTPSGHSAACIPSARVGKVWLAASWLPLFLPFRSVGQAWWCGRVSGCVICTIDHRWHYTLQKADALYFRKMVGLFSSCGWYDRSGFENGCFQAARSVEKQVDSALLITSKMKWWDEHLNAGSIVLREIADPIFHLNSLRNWNIWEYKCMKWRLVRCWTLYAQRSFPRCLWKRKISDSFQMQYIIWLFLMLMQRTGTKLLLDIHLLRNFQWSIRKTEWRSGCPRIVL